MMRIPLLLALTITITMAHAKTLRYATQDEPQTLDPHAAALAVSTRLLSNVYEGLVMRDKDFKIVPALAVSWSQPTTTVWRFQLRPNVKFHDGTPFTADDVVFSVGRALSPTSQFRSALLGVRSARKIDNLTVDFLLHEPNPVLLSNLAYFRIMSLAWSKKHGVLKPQNYKEKEDSFASRNTNGTGPYMVKERQPDVRIVLVENKAWWNRESPERGNVSEVIWLPIKSASTRAAALLSGEVDFVNDPPPQDVARYRAMPSVKVVASPEQRVQYLMMNTSRDELLYGNVKGKNPLKDLRVRQAIAHAIDIEAIKTKVMRGLSNPIGTMVTQTEIGYAADADKRLPLDIAKGKKLLAEAGYPNGFEITLDCGNNQPAADICQSMPAMLGKIGITVKPNIVPTANYFAKLQKFDTSFYLLSYGSPASDAFEVLQFILRTRDGKHPSNGDGNYGQYSHPGLDRALDAARIETDMTKRDAYLREAQLHINREMPVIPLHQAIIPWAMKKNITAVFPPNSVPYFFRFRVD